MLAAHPGFRIFVLGAGFSRPAGLPLAIELFSEVRSRIQRRHGRDTKFQRDLDNYIEYRTACDAVALHESAIDLEEFMSFLDIEHFLELRGSDTWSQEGNESQLMVRKAIGEVIHSRTPPADRLPDAYYNFAERLTPEDTVLTFNYDVLLERALEHVGKPYRLFSHRFKSVGPSKNVVDSDVEEVTVLKLHGSVDWFDDRQFLELKAARAGQESSTLPIHSVFDDPRRYRAEPLVEGPRSADDPLLHIHRIRDADVYYSQDNGFNAPFILSPSHVKFVYAEPLLSFWNGMGRSGGYNLGISVVGFSLPRHDEYIRIGLFQMISNYQQSWWDDKTLGVLKDNVRLVDFRTDAAGVAEYKARYGFVDPAKSECMFGGFNNDAVEFLFNQSRAT
jgi:SIR2-like domain